MIIVQPHSFVDIITNSSTELFVCETDKTLELVKGILHDFVTHHNAGVKLGLYGYEVRYEQVFKDPYIGTKETAEMVGWFESYQPLKNKVVGAVIIEGRTDNTIPYYMWDGIEDLFNATRIHMG
jgi:hypothetical protein